MYLQDLSYEVIDLLLTTFFVIVRQVKKNFKLLVACMFIDSGANTARRGQKNPEPRVQHLQLSYCYKLNCGKADNPPISFYGNLRIT